MSAPALPINDTDAEAIARGLIDAGLTPQQIESWCLNHARYAVERGEVEQAETLRELAERAKQQAKGNINVAS